MGTMPEMFEVPGGPITLAFSKKGRAFFSERITGNLWELVEDEARLVHSFPIVKATGHHEAGLLGIALDPDFEKNEQIYCFYTKGRDLKSCHNIISRITVGADAEEVILDNIPAGQIHNGGIMAFGPDGKLYAGVGIQNERMEKSQDIDFWGGKILRINPDGSFPDDNPFPDSPVFSFGHRNIFGLAFHPQTSTLYISEEGPEKNDEINVIEAGGNYGWPEVTGVAGGSKYIDPIITFTPTITPTQNCFFEDDLYFGSYNEGTVHKLVLDKANLAKVISDKVVYEGRPFGVVGVFVSPEGEFYVATINKIAKFEPVKG